MFYCCTYLHCEDEKAERGQCDPAVRGHCAYVEWRHRAYVEWRHRAYVEWRHRAYVEWRHRAYVETVGKLSTGPPRTGGYKQLSRPPTPPVTLQN